MTPRPDTASTFDNGHGDMWGWARTPGFNPMKLAAVVAGFAIFPPLGAAALIYFLVLAKRHRGWQGGRAGGCHARHRGYGWRNTAFEAHRRSVLDELEAEERAFAEYHAEQRRRRDQEAFDAFRASREPADGGDQPQA